MSTVPDDNTDSTSSEGLDAELNPHSHEQDNEETIVLMNSDKDATSSSSHSSPIAPVFIPPTPGEDDVAECRICRGDEPPLLENVCNCRGSLGYVHSDCVVEWVSTSGKEFVCEICKQEYNHIVTRVWDRRRICRCILYTFFSLLLIAFYIALNYLCVVYWCLPISKSLFSEFTFWRLFSFICAWSVEWSLFTTALGTIFVSYVRGRTQIFQPRRLGTIYPQTAQTPGQESGERGGGSDSPTPEPPSPPRDTNNSVNADQVLLLEQDSPV